MHLISFHKKYLQNFKYNHGVSQEEKIFYILHKLGNKTQLRSKCTVNPLMSSVGSGESGGQHLWKIYHIYLEIGIEASAFYIPDPGAMCSKPLGGSKVDSAFHPSKVDKMSTRNFWELSGKKRNYLLKVALALRQLKPIHKKGP